MLQPILATLSPLLHPTDRLRWQCLLLLATLVTAMLYLGTRPGISEIFPFLPWDKLLHATAYGAYAALGWVAMAGRSLWGPVLLAGAIGMMDEGAQYYTPGRSADFRDIIADLIGAMLIVLVLRTLQRMELRQRAPAR